MRFILEDSGARLLAATREMAEAAQAAAPPGCALLDAEAAWPDAPAPPAAGAEDDPLLLVYTSGTTGRPKGAVLDQRALRANAENARHAFGLTAADRVLTLLPMFHVGGLNIQTTPALLAGAEVVLLPRFDPEATFAAIAAHRPTLTLLVPAVMQALVAHPGWAAADLASLRAIGAGSSEVPLPLIEAFHARGIPVQQVYGATETGPIAIVQTREEALAAPGSLGTPALHGAARVVDAAGRDLPAGTPARSSCAARISRAATGTPRPRPERPSATAGSPPAMSASAMPRAASGSPTG
ncbi:AMP-binding protein [Dankookia sp. P2]|uniref:AMP-binding protein n=1 Tax=Dankookia sp. P2 TaxID=3423955 RepID=UPI003D67505E